jgi:2-succinyl-5-enolpyruvyl-6-hydroxy-3-cyclohexene-1-carboxylate synthase
MATDDTGKLNLQWATQIAHELVHQGVSHVCLSPGSRCTPLTVAAARHDGIDAITHYDERGAAFHAVGYGRATGQPAALIATSGTAVANYLPAVIEAATGRVPLLLITGDRPPELRHTGANQTIDQVKIFGDYVRWHVDLPCPAADIPLAMIGTTIAQAVYRTGQPLPGPVHINCMFREPFLPPPGEAAKLGCDTSGTVWHAPTRAPDASAIEELTEIIRSSERRLLVVGQLSAAELPAVTKLADHLQWQLFADITSGLRLGNTDSGRVTYYDRLLQSNRFAESLNPDLILHLGGRILSKGLLQFISDSSAAYIHAADHPEREDPHHRVDLRIETDLPALCKALKKACEPAPADSATVSESSIDTAIDTVLDDSTTQTTEAAIARTIARNIPADDALFLGNSMPVRDMDLFAPADGKAVPIGVNRGASGIDGLIATATGYACGIQRNVTLLIGDLSCLHDLVSLQLAHTCHLTIVILNNKGGGIFTHLPIAKHNDVFEPYFLTPHSMHFAAAGDMFGLGYTRTATTVEFHTAYQAAIAGNVSTIIEVDIDQAHNLQIHQRLSETIAGLV